MYKAVLLVLLVSSISAQTLDYPTSNVITYLTGDNKFVAQMEPKVEGITIKAFLLSKDDLATSKTKGYWVGIGFGTVGMENSDIVLFQQDNGVLTCTDAVGIVYGVNNDKDVGTFDDVTAVATGNGIKDITGSTDPNLKDYKTLTTWNCIKAFRDGDKNDWAGYKDWWTKKENTDFNSIGAVGLLAAASQATSMRALTQQRKPAKHEKTGRVYVKLVLRDNFLNIPGTPPSPSTPTSSSYFRFLGLATLSLLLLVLA